MRTIQKYFETFGKFLRVGLAFLILLVLTAQFQSNSQAADFSAINFFSYFTVQSNIFTAFVLLLGATVLFKGKPETVIISSLRGASVVYMIVTALIFALLLSESAAKDPYILPEANFIFHRLVPLLVFIDWLLLPPQKLGKITILYWLIFPALWLLYSYGHAWLTQWYVYDFLDTTKAGGIFGVLLYLTPMALGLIILSFGVIGLGNFVNKNFRK